MGSGELGTRFWVARWLTGGLTGIDCSCQWKKSPDKNTLSPLNCRAAQGAWGGVVA